LNGNEWIKLHVFYFLFFKLPLKEAILKPISKTDNYRRRMVDQNQKVDYWFYYYENGNKKKAIMKTIKM
jgi:hypothetical protein